MKLEDFSEQLIDQQDRLNDHIERGKQENYTTTLSIESEVVLDGNHYTNNRVCGVKQYEPGNVGSITDAIDYLISEVQKSKESLKGASIIKYSITNKRPNGTIISEIDITSPKQLDDVKSFINTYCLV